MIPAFNGNAYFLDLVALCVILLPLMYVLPWAPARRIAMALAGLYLLYFIAPRLALFYGLAWALVFVVQQLVARTAERAGGLGLFWAAALLVLAPMLTWKLFSEPFTYSFNLWTNAALGSLSATLQEIDLASNILIPVGLSFATFRAVDLLVKSYLGQVPPLSFDRVMFYGLFPPVQVVGPIIEYGEIGPGGEQRMPITAEDLWQGSIRIALGFLKVFAIAGVLKSSASVFQSYTEMPVYLIWAYLFAYTWYFYVNFSGYSDLAIGTARLFGFRLRENFSYPFFRRNLADFWNHWHASLSRFAQRNVFVPLGGYRKRTQRLAIFCTMMVIALWHDLTLGMVVFGTYHGLGLIVHRQWADGRARNALEPGLARRWTYIGATYLYVTLSFPLLALPLERAGHFYLALLGVSA